MGISIIGVDWLWKQNSIEGIILSQVSTIVFVQCLGQSIETIKEYPNNRISNFFQKNSVLNLSKNYFLLLNRHISKFPFENPHGNNSD